MNTDDYKSSVVLVLLLMLTLTLSLSCCAQTNNYLVKVIYDPVRHVRPSRITDKWKMERGDSTIFFFESGFLNDSLRISGGGKKVETNLTTYEIGQFAKSIAMPSKYTVNFSINGGKQISISPSIHKYFSINFRDNVIVVEVYSDFPYYE